MARRPISYFLLRSSVETVKLTMASFSCFFLRLLNASFCQLMNLIAFFMRSISLWKIQKTGLKRSLMQKHTRAVHLCEERCGEAQTFLPTPWGGTKMEWYKHKPAWRKQSTCSNRSSNRVKGLKAFSCSLTCQGILNCPLYVPTCQQKQTTNSCPPVMTPFRHSEFRLVFCFASFFFSFVFCLLFKIFIFYWTTVD